ncbi:MAG: AEC family transporter [Devosia sp.]|nr:AEC family transporter [Devosia sp.]
MFAILNVVIPVFAIIGLGYFAVRFRLYPTEGVRGLVAFVNNFATPCLLFQAMLTSDFGTAFNWSIIGPFYAGSLFSLVAGTIIAVKFFGNRPGEGVSSGFAAMFTNTVLIGIPIMQRAYGEGSLPVVFSIIAFHAPMLITIGMLVMELVRRDGAPLHRALGVAALRIVQNPLLWGVGLGLLANAYELELPEPGTAFLTMMSAAVLPAALFGLGGALNEYRLSENWAQALAMSSFKLVIHPTIAWVLMVPVLKLDPEIARYGVLLAAMPTGINAYVFATYYNRAVNVATNTVLISTVASILTVSVWLYVLSL